MTGPKFIFFAVLFLGFLPYGQVFSVGRSWESDNPLEFEITQKFPCQNIPGAPACPEPTDVYSFINRFYLFSLGIAGALAVGLIVFGGLQYVYSAASPDKQRDAVDRIRSAVAGLALLVGAAFILRTINPNLAQMGEPKSLAAIPNVEEVRTTLTKLGGLPGCENLSWWQIIAVIKCAIWHDITGIGEWKDPLKDLGTPGTQ